MADDLDELSGGLGRMLSTARLAGRLGRKTAGRVLFGARSEAAGKGSAEADGSDATVAAARRLVAQMSQLKGLVMKAGQIASYMPGSEEAESPSAKRSSGRSAEGWQAPAGRRSGDSPPVYWCGGPAR